MTAYSVAVQTTFASTIANSGNVDLNFAIVPGLYEIKVSSIEYSMLNTVQTTASQYAPSAWGYPEVYRNNGGSASGGTAITPSPLRHSAAAASATSRVGTGTTVSGTPVFLTATPNFGNITFPLSANYAFPYDVTVAPGSSFLFSIVTRVNDGGSGGATITATVRIAMYFEELRLSWPY
jgi:hypothetical protein